MTTLELLNEWYDDVARDTITISDDAQTEAARNMWGFSLTSAQARELSVSDLACFVNRIGEARAEQINRRRLSRMLFYLWHDEISGRLCFSLISLRRERSPEFRCAINATATLNTIVAEYLSSAYLNGIPASELVTTENPLASRSLSEGERVLDVFVMHLPD
jgi:hypothetical protein